MEIFLDDRSCREVEEHSVKSSNMQWRNLRIFLSLKFCVKSLRTNFVSQIKTEMYQNLNSTFWDSKLANVDFT